MGEVVQAQAHDREPVTDACNMSVDNHTVADTCERGHEVFETVWRKLVRWVSGIQPQNMGPESAGPTWVPDECMHDSYLTSCSYA